MEYLPKMFPSFTDQNTSAVPASWGVPEPNTSLPDLLCVRLLLKPACMNKRCLYGLEFLSLFVCLFVSQPRKLTSNSRPSGGTSQSY